MYLHQNIHVDLYVILQQAREGPFSFGFTAFIALASGTKMLVISTVCSIYRVNSQQNIRTVHVLNTLTMVIFAAVGVVHHAIWREPNMVVLLFRHMAIIPDG